MDTARKIEGPFGIPKVDVYRVNPTFTLSLDMLEEYRNAIMESIMHNRFVLMRDGRTLKWIDELIEKEKKANPEKEEAKDKKKAPIGV